jgi:hypothetical protein
MERLRVDQSCAEEKARRWAERATTTRKAGRDVNANRCEDKARDWSSRARQIERKLRTS